tara:strand:+ start:990 stop:1166 length:177 start_codon:yes stop_codon:yes gene_type:complete
MSKNSGSLLRSEVGRRKLIVVIIVKMLGTLYFAIVDAILQSLRLAIVSGDNRGSRLMD